MIHLISNFEKSFYKFVNDNYVKCPLYYGRTRVDPENVTLWAYIFFSEFNLDSGGLSTAYLDVVSRIQEVGPYNSVLYATVDDFVTLFTNADIPLYDFGSGSPMLVDGSKILVQSLGRKTYERIEELEFEGNNQLLHAKQISLNLKLLEDFARKKVV